VRLELVVPYDPRKIREIRSSPSRLYCPSSTGVRSAATRPYIFFATLTGHRYRWPSQAAYRKSFAATSYAQSSRSIAEAVGSPAVMPHAWIAASHGVARATFRMPVLYRASVTTGGPSRRGGCGSVCSLSQSCSIRTPGRACWSEVVT
jgi:hypothetical protein